MREVTISDPQSFYNMRVLITDDNWFLPTNFTRPIITCPACKGSLLGDDAPHGIDEEGNVNASVVCEHPKCKFHAMVKLENWNHGIVKHK